MVEKIEKHRIKIVTLFLRLGKVLNFTLALNKTRPGYLPKDSEKVQEYVFSKSLYEYSYVRNILERYKKRVQYIWKKLGSNLPKGKKNLNSTKPQLLRNARSLLSLVPQSS